MTRTSCCLIVLLLVGCVAVAEGPPDAADTRRLTLLVTSGTGGRLTADDLTVAALAATVRAEVERARAADRDVVVLDAGRTLAPYAESRFDGGRAMIDVLAEAGVQVFAPDPMDLTTAAQTLTEAAARGRLEVLRPWGGDDSSPLARRAILDLGGGLRVAVASLAAESILDEIVAAAGVDAGRLTAQAAFSDVGDELRLAVVHSEGRGASPATRELTWRLLGEMDVVDVAVDPDLGVDLVAERLGPEGTAVLVGRRREGARWDVSRVELRLHHDGRRWRPTEADLAVIDADPSLPQDPALVARVEEAISAFDRAYAMPLPEGAPSTREELERFVLEALRERAWAEVAVLNRGALRPVAPRHFEGEMTEEAVVRLLSLDQEPVRVTLSGAELAELATTAARRREPGGAPRSDSLVFAGLEYEVESSGEEATASEVRVNGRPLRGEEEYRVATTRYLATGGDDHEVLTEAEASPLRGARAGPLELREDVVLPRLRVAERPFTDLERRAVWRWGAARLATSAEGVRADHAEDYDAVTDSRASADDSSSLLLEAALFADREKPGWAWENRLDLTYGLLDTADTDLDETADDLVLESSAVLTSRAVLGGGHPYGSVKVDSELRPNDAPDGEELPRQVEYSLTAGVDWQRGHWPRIRVGLVGRRYAHVDRDDQVGVSAEAVYHLDPEGSWPGLDGRLYVERLDGGDGTVDRADLDLRLLVPLRDRFILLPALNWYRYEESRLDGAAEYLRYTVGLSYSWQTKRQAW